MHHTLDRGRPPLAGVRLRSDVDDEIASENRAIARIEEQIDQVPLYLKTCAYCSALATVECGMCDEPLCEDDGVWSGIDVCCPECLGLRP